MEDRVKKAVQFLSNPKSKIQTAQFTTLDKKYEFLRSKISPAEFEEAKKRYEESKDFSKYFEPATVAEQQSAASWNTRILKIIGGGLIGLVGFGYIFSKGANDESNIDQIKSLLEKKFAEQQPAIESIRQQISDVRFEIENLKKAQDELHLAIESLHVVKEEVKIEKEDPKLKINELFDSCFSGISDNNKGVALKTMKMWLSNLISNPFDKSKSRINMTNPHYKNYFSGNQAADELFRFIGFAIKAGFVEFESEDLTNVGYVLDKITEAINSLPSPQYSPAAPWQVAKPLDKKEEAKEEEKKTENTEIKPE